MRCRSGPLSPKALRPSASRRCSICVCAIMFIRREAGWSRRLSGDTVCQGRAVPPGRELAGAMSVFWRCWDSFATRVCSMNERERGTRKHTHNMPVPHPQRREDIFALPPWCLLVVPPPAPAPPRNDARRWRADGRARKRRKLKDLYLTRKVRSRAQEIGLEC